MQSWIAGVVAGGLLVFSANNWAAIDNLVIAPTVGMAPGLVVPTDLGKDCAWSARVGKSLVASSKGQVTIVDEASLRDARRKIEITTTKLVAPQSDGRIKRRLGFRVQIVVDGKVLAMTKVEDRTLSTVGVPVCGLIEMLAGNLGEDIAEWLTKASLPMCDAACTGLHPDQPIALGKEILMVAPEAVDDPARNCNWSNEKQIQLVDDGIDEEYQIYEKFFITDQDILQYPGRKLVLKVTHMVTRGSAFSGDKWMEMTGELVDGGMVAASFRTSESTGSGSFFNVCSTVIKLSDRIYVKYRKWLAQPILNAELN